MRVDAQVQYNKVSSNFLSLENANNEEKEHPEGSKRSSSENRKIRFFSR